MESVILARHLHVNARLDNFLLSNYINKDRTLRAKPKHSFIIFL